MAATTPNSDRNHCTCQPESQFSHWTGERLSHAAATAPIAKGTGHAARTLPFWLLPPIPLTRPDGR